VEFLSQNNFDIYVDWWNEQHLYFGKYGNDVMEIDRMFGSEKFKLSPDLELLAASVKKILQSPIDPKTFHQRNFMKSSTDIIAIEKSLSERMKMKFVKE